MCEYGTLKAVELILGRGRGRGRTMEGMNQTGVHYSYMEMSQLPLNQLLYTNKNSF
jgi:hypothetical protein